LVNKAVIPAAGLGSRLLPATKETPKEMLPLFVRMNCGRLCVKPLLQIIFQELYTTGFDNFYFITGRTKRSIEDYFTPDYNYLTELKKRDKLTLANEIEEFYKIIEKVNIFWVNQLRPKGFGDAILRVKPLISDNEAFIVYAGDNYIISPNQAYLHKLIDTHSRLESDATFLVNEVDDPRQYGVISGELLEEGIFKVEKVVEKPLVPPSKLAIHAVYVFNKKIFKAIENITVNSGGELQLTDAIQWLIEHKSKVYAVQLGSDEVRIDVGAPHTYWQAIKASWENSQVK
jgi:UTP--glucose-1-phosphate uridylyltransferase